MDALLLRIISMGNTTSVQVTTDDPAMRITPAEKVRSLQIKAAMEADPRLNKLSDFEYTQYALTGADDPLDCICERAYLQQEFKKLYHITDDLVEGLLLFYGLTLQQPGLVLSITYMQSAENYPVIMDAAAFTASSITTRIQHRIFLGAFFYLFQSQSPNFQSIRNGLSFLVECQPPSSEASYSNNCPRLRTDFLEKILAELLGHYPANLKECYLLHSAMAINLAFAYTKRLLPKRAQDKVHAGVSLDCISGLPLGDGVRLDKLYTVPNLEAAQERSIGHSLQFLTLRYRNQSEFSLAKASVVDHVPIMT